MRNVMRILLTAFIALVMSASMVNAKTYKMKIGHIGSTDGDDYSGASFIKSYLESRSNGQIEVEIFSNGQMGSFRDHV